VLGSYYILKYTDIAHVYVYGCMFLFFYFFPFSLALSGVRADSLASNHNFGDVSSDSSGDDEDGEGGDGGEGGGEGKAGQDGGGAGGEGGEGGESKSGGEGGLPPTLSIKSPTPRAEAVYDMPLVSGDERRGGRRKGEGGSNMKRRGRGRWRGEEERVVLILCSFFISDSSSPFLYILNTEHTLPHTVTHTITHTVTHTAAHCSCVFRGKPI
jgi:hypothetical protein